MPPADCPISAISVVSLIPYVIFAPRITNKLVMKEQVSGSGFLLTKILDYKTNASAAHFGKKKNNKSFDWAKSTFCFNLSIYLEFVTNSTSLHAIDGFLLTTALTVCKNWTIVKCFGKCMIHHAIRRYWRLHLIYSWRESHTPIRSPALVRINCQRYKFLLAPNMIAIAANFADHRYTFWWEFLFL